MRGAVHMQITTIGLDIAKNVFQVHGIDSAEKVIVRKRLRRSQVLVFFKALPPCLIGMEACATAHYWARELTKLGHKVRLMPAKDVKAYVKRNKLHRQPISAEDAWERPRRGLVIKPKGRWTERLRRREVTIAVRSDRGYLFEGREESRLDGSNK